ncbi:MAG TPA: hypothetical protein VI959_04430 [Alphaproteobacteria bacterium]|nr:hypothetical protein [Alphaproteobacteria bacterium]
MISAIFEVSKKAVVIAALSQEPSFEQGDLQPLLYSDTVIENIGMYSGGFSPKEGFDLYLGLGEKRQIFLEAYINQHVFEVKNSDIFWKNPPKTGNLLQKFKGLKVSFTPGEHIGNTFDDRFSTLYHLLKLYPSFDKIVSTVDTVKTGNWYGNSNNLISLNKNISRTDVTWHCMEVYVNTTTSMKDEEFFSFFSKNKILSLKFSVSINYGELFFKEFCSAKNVQYLEQLDFSNSVLDDKILENLSKSAEFQSLKKLNLVKIKGITYLGIKFLKDSPTFSKVLIAHDNFNNSETE